MAKASTEFLQTAFQDGEIEVKGQFTLGSNYTFLVNVKHEGRQLPAVYKPMRGEQPLWDFPPASLAGREVAAYLLSQALGFDFIPYTILRDGPFGPGSLQEYIDYDPNYHYFNFEPADRLRLRPVVLFDLLANNADRKGSHVLIEKHTRRLFLIDHGLCFHEDPKLRTVLWDFAGEAIPQELVETLSAFRHGFGPGMELRTALGEYLLPEELAALEARARALLTAGRFPDPPEDRRAYPYPPL
ncbi:MAG TPA: SCO1664 family protein [Anaerolineales bacterium]|nr:SCO1664 family protein [Anaerolineales bacterium]